MIDGALMDKRLLRAATLVLFVPILILGGGRSAVVAQTSLASVHSAVIAIKTEKQIDARRAAAVKLSELTRTIAPDEVDDRTIDDMISLLGTDDDVVLNYVAVSLGNLGPRAKKAVPTLLRILPKADCVQGDRTAVAAIRPALRKMGATAPPKKEGGCKAN
jgi:hypothetical protein